MAKTVIALMESLDEAQAVVRELIEAGIAREDIGFMADQKHDLPGTAQLNESEGSADAGGILVAVAADRTAHADAAVAIMRRHGAAEIDERATEWKKQGWKGRF